MFSLFGKAKENLDAVQMLEDDHVRVKELFSAFKEMEDSDDPALIGIVTTACLELMVHSKIEMEIFYPAIEEAGDEELSDQLAEAEIEHEAIDVLVERLLGEPLPDMEYKANFKVVLEFVEHHIKEEEDEMFPKVRDLKLNLKKLGAKMRERQLELVEEISVNPGIATAAVVRGGRKQSDARTNR